MYGSPYTVVMHDALNMLLFWCVTCTICLHKAGPLAIPVERSPLTLLAYSGMYVGMFQPGVLAVRSHVSHQHENTANACIFL